MSLSSAPFRLLFEKSPYPVAIFDRQTLFFLAVNQAAIRHYGYSRREFLRMTVKDIRPPEEVPAALAYLAKNIQGKVPRTHDGQTWKHRKKDGAIIDVELMLFHVIYKGREAGLAVVQDVTKRREIQERLRAFRDLMDESNDAVFIVDPVTGRFQDCNGRAVEWLGYARKELMKMGVGDIAVSMTDPWSWKRHVARVRKHGGVIREDYARRKDGSTFPIEVSVRLIARCRKQYLVAILRDTRVRKRMEREILEVSEEERRRIGRDIHDGLSQTLTSIGLLCKALESRWKDRTSEPARLLEEMAQAIQEVRSQARDIAKLLLPAELRDREIAGALKLLARHISTASGIPCDLETSGVVALSDATVSINLFRIAQEAVHNAVKHGEAAHIRISLAGTGRGIELVVSDDGVGLGPQGQFESGYGMRLMRYRAGAIGASLQITPNPKRGTSVRCFLPNAGALGSLLPDEILSSCMPTVAMGVNRS
ncbi:MAG: PAS domain-containing sensor histidine kinase [Proteobacteria bacterium]|nr:PAS domain-containing sensor histidine kinase [Pseudomonadota bacterium]